MSNLIEMHDVGNSYGNLDVWEADGKFFWDIGDYDSHRYSLAERGNEIPESLYKELLAHFHKDKSARDREEAMQGAILEGQAKAQAEEFAAIRVASELAKQEYRKNNPICDYATPKLMLEGYYAGKVDRDALLRTLEETGIEHTLCDVTGLIELTGKWGISDE